MFPNNSSTPPIITGSSRPKNWFAQLFGKYRLFLIIGAVIIIVGCGGTTYYLMSRPNAPSTITITKDATNTPKADTKLPAKTTTPTTTDAPKTTDQPQTKTTPPSSGGGSSGGGGSSSGGSSSGPIAIKIMPLGDSMTQGGVNGGSPGLYTPTANGYRLDLLNLLTGYTVDFVGPYQVGNSSLSDKDEAGESGACIKVSPCGGSTMYPLTAGWLNTYNPDLVIMQGGGNDYSQSGMTDATAESYIEDWIQLVWATKPNVKIIVSGEAQWHPELEALTKTYVEGKQAQGKAIRFVPLAATAAADANTIDQTHPNPTGYQIWANELAPMVQALFP